MKDYAINLVCTIHMKSQHYGHEYFQIDSPYPFKGWRSLSNPIRFCDEVMDKVSSVEEEVFNQANKMLETALEYARKNPYGVVADIELDEVFTIRGGTKFILGFELNVAKSPIW